jgi:pimeloyl-ACP methyl ester carboxylesterase
LSTLPPSSASVRSGPWCLAIAVPTIVVHGGDDAFGRPSGESTAGERATLPKLIDKRIVEGAGHFVLHEKPEAVALALLDLLSATQ